MSPYGICFSGFCHIAHFPNRACRYGCDLGAGLVGGVLSAKLLSKSKKFKKDFPEHYQDLVAEIKRENAGADASVMAAQMFTKVCAISARALYPIFEATDKQYGFVCMQVDPREVKNTEAMIQQVDFWYDAMKKELGVEEPNVVFKLPAVEPAFKAAEALLQKNYKLCMTLNFTVTQHAAFAEILSKGSKPGYLVLMASNPLCTT